jgi:hypothetical protein
MTYLTLAIGLLISICCFGLLSLSILSIRDEHPAHVYTLWYMFSLIFCICYILFLCFPGLITGFTTDGSVNIIEKYSRIMIKISEDVLGEIYLILTILIILIFPQLMSFLISGLSGCAGRPILVSKISELATLSIIKFFCVLAGIHAAIALSTWAVDRANNGLISLVMITVSFTVLSCHYQLRAIRQDIIAHPALKRLERSIKYMSRYREDIDGQMFMESMVTGAIPPGIKPTPAVATEQPTNKSSERAANGS